MASSADGCVALLSIHPRFSSAIFEGEKNVEFRRIEFKELVSHVLVYETAPTMAVVGWFSVGAIRVGAPSTIWRRYSRTAGLARAEFMSYFEGTQRAVAIEVKEAHRLRKPIPLESLGLGTPPQSFRYVAEGTFRKASQRRPPFVDSLGLVVNRARGLASVVATLFR